MREPAVVFVLRMDEHGKLSWNSTLPVPLLNLALDKVKLGILADQVEERKIVAPTNGETQAVKRVLP